MSKDIHSIIDKIVEEKQESLAAVEHKRQLQQKRAIGKKYLDKLESLASYFRVANGYPLLHTEGNPFTYASTPVAYSNEVWAAAAISQGAETVEEITEFVSDIRNTEWDQECTLMPIFHGDIKRHEFRGSLVEALIGALRLEDLHARLEVHDPTKPCFCDFQKPSDSVTRDTSYYNTTHEEYYQQKFKEMLDASK